MAIIALLGRPNVGKSTLFNRLTKSRQALVADLPGLTRDRKYGRVDLSREFNIDESLWVVDTGGLGEETDAIDHLMASQTQQAIDEADLLVFLVDARVGLTGADKVIAQDLRTKGKPVLLVVNKIDGLDDRQVTSEFYELGFDEPICMAASQNRGVRSFRHDVVESLIELDLLPKPQLNDDSSEAHSDDDHDDAASKTEKFKPIPPDALPEMRLAIIGRPNVGKSTLVNRLLGESRVVVCDLPGTTRDRVDIPLERHGRQMTLIDTAGVRRRGKIYESVEKFSVIKTFEAIEDCHVAIMMFDATEGVTQQDLSILRLLRERGAGLVLAFNKWDGLEAEQKEKFMTEVERRLEFLGDYKQFKLSALHGTNVGHLVDAAESAFSHSFAAFKTNELTDLINAATEQNPPPMQQGRRIKLRFAHQGAQNPPTIVIHGNQTDALPDHYKRYLSKLIQRQYKLQGTPVELIFKTGDNPYSHIRNKLTPRQERKRKRTMKKYKK